MTTPIHTTLIITGSIAAVKAADVASRLKAQGITVDYIITEAAKRWAGEELLASTWQGAPEELLKKTDAVLVAPATADFLKQLVQQDTSLAKAICGSNKPLTIVPAMNMMMWQHPATQRNVNKLLEWQINFLGPVDGNLACGDVGYGRFMEPEYIVEAFISGTEHEYFQLIHQAISDSNKIPARSSQPIKKLCLMLQNYQQDSADNLQQALQAKGYEVTIATNQQEGLQASQEIYSNHFQHDLEGMEHIRLSEQVDVMMVIFPTTEGLQEMAEGGAHSFLGATYLASKKPVLLFIDPATIAPTAVQHIQQLADDGVVVLESEPTTITQVFHQWVGQYG